MTSIPGSRPTMVRVCDFTVASLLLVASLPVLVLAMLAVQIESRGPAFVNETRIGRNGRPFKLYKLRTAVLEAEAQTAMVPRRNEVDRTCERHDAQVTGLGRLLRRSSIDELPQLWCVVTNTMSLVGPPPALAEEVAHWDADVLDRSSVLPGLTGTWQASAGQTHRSSLEPSGPFG